MRTRNTAQVTGILPLHKLPRITDFNWLCRRRAKPRYKTGRKPVLIQLKKFLALARRPDLQGDCTEPVTREIHSRDVVYDAQWWYRPLNRPVVHDYATQWFTRYKEFPDHYEWRTRRVYAFGAGRILHAEIRVRCRKCSKCTRHKRRLWTARAHTEMDNSERTWMLTLTLGFHARLEGGKDVKWMKKEVSKYLKRLREHLGTGLPLRHLCAFEYHKDGTCHAHLLIHDLTGFIPKRAIQKKWTHGFSNCKLADKGSPAYVAKYIAKDLAGGRIPASLRYGQSSPQD